MSVEVMTAVWDWSTAYGGDLLILLAIANYADINGRAYPSVGTLAQRGRMTERNAQYCIKKLEAMGELKVERNAGPHGTHIFQILIKGAKFSEVQSFLGCKVFTHRKKRKRNKELTSTVGENFSGVQSFQGETHFAGGVKPISPEPSLDPSVKEQIQILPPEKAHAFSSPSGVEQMANAPSTPQRKRSPTKAASARVIPEWSETLPWPDPLSLIALYHARKPDTWSRCDVASEARLVKCRAYLAQFPTREFWEQVFTNLHTSAFLRETLSNRTLDWLVQKGKNDGIENCLQVQEGYKYRDTRGARDGPQPGELLRDGTRMGKII
jgi:hypothetical protein